MLKAFTTMTFMLLLCSCEIFGWDSAGGNNGGNPTSGIDGDEMSELANLYYVDVPMGYPNTGSAAPTETAGGSQITIPDLVEQPRSIVITPENALLLTQAACDETATSILNINSEETETTVTWQNSSMSMGSLSLSKEQISDPPLQVITCIN